MERRKAHGSMRYCFGEFSVNVRLRVLRYRGTPVELSAKLFDLLLVLLDSPGAPISKNHLLRKVWHGSTNAKNVNTHIWMLRKALARFDATEYIVTRPKVGFQFVGDVNAQADSAGMPTRFDSFVAYCRGQHFLEQRTERGLTNAIACFSEVLLRDPNDFQAMVALANAHMLLGGLSLRTPIASYSPARTWLERALRLDPTSGLARALHGELLLAWKYDWAASAAELAQAIRMSPHSIVVHRTAAWMYLAFGRFDEALEEVRHLLSIDPASLFIQSIGARAYLHAGDANRAIAWYSQILRTDPTQDMARHFLALAFMANGQPDRALPCVANVSAKEHPDRLAARGWVHAANGKTRTPRDILAVLTERAKRRYVAHHPFAVLHMAMGNIDLAYKELRAAVRDSDPSAVRLANSPYWRTRHNDASFREILVAVNNNVPSG